MSSAAQRNDMVGLFDCPQEESESTPALREAVAERLRAHRARTREAQVEQELAAAREAAAGSRHRVEARETASRVRKAVTQRYQESLSYREFLAAEAERALQQAQAEADIAARKAKAVAEVQMQLLQELEQFREPELGPREIAIAAEKADARHELAHALADLAMGARELIAEPLPHQPVSMPLDFTAPSCREAHAGEVSAGSLTVRLYEDIGTNRNKPAYFRLSNAANRHLGGEPELNDLEDEIDFRRSPEFEPHIIETTTIPANLIEFPRQLIAPRKARPRLAEGPLREDLPPEPQLRIFEVEADQISTEPAVVETGSVAEWQTLLLDGSPVRLPDAPAAAQTQFVLQPQIAPLELRLMAAAVDACCLLGSFAAFACVFIEIAGPSARNLPLPMLAAAIAGVLGIMFVLYQLLFFSLSDATPGMRYARIGLCTFSDENPTRKAMRRRVFSMLLAACPLGMGLVWVFMDVDSLGWHDRMSRMYQRAY